MHADGLLERVQAVVPLVAERAMEAEQQRKPADDVIDALKATGVFRSLVPRRHGGYEIDLDLFLDIGLAVSEADASTGWITTFYMEHNWLLGMFPEELQDEVFGNQPYVLAPGSVNPTGEATRHPDHLELSGHWQFGTGIVHADWVLLSGKIVGDEPEIPRMFLVPVADVEVKDTWHVDGMAATGSRDIVATTVDVPLHRVSGMPAATWALDLDAPYLERIPMQPFLSMTAAIPALGCATRAVALFRHRVTERVLFGINKRQADHGSAQVRLANVAARVAIAETTLRAIAHDMTDHARGRRQLSMVEHLGMRVTIAHLVRMCRDIVRDVLEGSGAGAHFLDNELQRIQRDVHMIAAHTVFDLDLVTVAYGRALLGDNP
jgi:alkylation response protein AidB-like acyl-CoA dehydrogenase